jgi:hypothetical protein
VDEIVLSLYAKGLTTGEISAHFHDIYSVSVSKETISRITDKVIAEMDEWVNRPLDARRFLTIVANNFGDYSTFPLLHERVRGLVVEARAGSVIEFGGDLIELVAGPHAEISAFGEVLAEEAVGRSYVCQAAWASWLGRIAASIRR